MLVDFRRVLYADADADPDADAAHTRNWLTPTTFFTLNCLGNLFTQHHAPRQPPPTAANRAQPALTCLLLSVHVCVAYNTARQQQQHSRRPPFFVCVARQHSDSMAHTNTYIIHVCVCVRCQGHWQKAEVLLGSDFSFLFASAAMPFRVRLLCSAFCINCIFSYATPPPYLFSCALIVVGAFVTFLFTRFGCGCDCVCVRLHIRLAHISYIMVTK